jgi:hypothetical protein
MAYRLCSALLLSLAGWSCAALQSGPNDLHRQRNQDLPYCPGGKQDQHCLLGSDCRTTEKGCQVCQCEVVFEEEEQGNR